MNKKKNGFWHLGSSVAQRLGFSLVELMISLIVISVVTAAFAPVLTKRLRISDQSIGTATAVSITSNSICNAISSGCTECENDKCLAVSDGYFLNESTGKSQACNTTITGCAQCTDSSTCTKSEAGYFLNGTNTTKCNAGCSICTGISACTSCDSGYWKNGSSCTACSVQNTACQTCTNGSTCTKCAENYLLSGGKCVKCPNHCKVCSGSSVCTTCQSGYFKAINNVCFKYSCSGILCYLTKDNDSVLSIYRYSLGNGEVSIPTGINKCSVGFDCAYDASTPICWVASAEYPYYTSDPISGTDSGRASYNPAKRTVCNGRAAQVALESTQYKGWRVPNLSDVFYIGQIVAAQDRGEVTPADPFCSSGYYNYIPHCHPTHSCLAKNHYQGGRCASFVFRVSNYSCWGDVFPNVNVLTGCKPTYQAWFNEPWQTVFVK